ncbi:MAG: N-acyl-L-homoserine lactone synthetase [Rhodobacteraceae bacterium CG17_big_fil_post_rev_8_21_14_2_50_63_15]|nr:N-acyl-L-homoserine lactone synthetase [Roseovarius sp.]PIV78699.1 MAG: N-acyl-L-homoserine lactone synthetase [Rhodobacteraceae bacterium CG17_big_fil_post_rev_8_21_14_2_50_63_15]
MLEDLLPLRPLIKAGAEADGPFVRQRTRHAPEDLGNIRAVELSFHNFHSFGDLFQKYLKARKSIFIDRLNWHISEVEGMEFDQYDTPFCRWVVLVEFGEILGGVRLMPTTATCGIYSYMLRDAQRGLLDDFPTDVLFIDPPVDVYAWEATRFFITDCVPGARRRLIQQMLFSEMNRVAAENGARYILGIVPAIWSRWARRLEVTATPIGAPFSIDGSRSQAVLFKVDDVGQDASSGIEALTELSS